MTSVIRELLLSSLSNTDQLVIPFEGRNNTWLITIQYFTKPLKAYHDFSHY